MKTFFKIWFGQLISKLGSGLTGFALNLWVFQSTGSTSLFALASLMYVLPVILISPVAGVVGDRWDRSRIMLLTDLGGALCALAAFGLLYTQKAEVWNVCCIIALNAVFEAFRTPAWLAVTSQLVPGEQLNQASGMVQTSSALAQLVSPVLAGVLVAWSGVTGVLVIDVVTFLLATCTLIGVRTPIPEGSAQGGAGKRSMSDEFLEGWNYVRERAGLVGILVFAFALNFVMGMVQVSFVPLVMSQRSAAVLGSIMSAGGVGMLVGSVVLGTWKGPKRRMNGVLGFSVLLGLSLAGFGLLPVGPLLAIASFLMMSCVPFITGLSQVILQRKVAPALQGRVFALVTMVAQLSLPLAFIIVGPLVDKVLEPMMAPTGVLASGVVGQVLGVGKGRGVALLFINLGLIMIALVGAISLLSRVRRVEDELPDAEPAAPATALSPS